MRTLLALLLISTSAFAGEREVIQVRDGYVRNISGDTIQVAGGAYLNGPTMVDIAKELAELRARNEELSKLEAPKVEVPWVGLASVAVTLVIGVVTVLVRK